MYDEQPGEGRFLSAEEELEKVLKLARIGLFDRPFAAQGVIDTFGVDPAGYELHGREVKVETWTCASGHVHKDISLVESFRNAAVHEPALTLNAALEQVGAASLTDPEGSLGLLNNALRFRYAHTEDGTLSKIFLMQQVYHTAATLSGEEQQPTGQKHKPCDLKFKQS